MTSFSNEAEFQSSRVELGRVVGAHALRGEVRVRWLGDGPQNLLSVASVWLGENRKDPESRCYPVLSRGSGRSGEVRLGLEGVTDRTAAEALRGQMVMIGSEDLEPLDEDEYYWHELIGFTVETLQGERVGEVQEIWDTGGHDVLVIRSDSGRQVLVPTAREIMQEIDGPTRRIRIEALPGLIDEAE